MVIMSVHRDIDNEFVNDFVDDPVTLISRLDISNPLHLHPNNSTTLTVVSIKLKGTKNYQVWSCAMLLALEGKNKIGFIDGSCRRANNDEEELKETYDKVDGSITFSLHHKIHTLRQNGSSIADYYHRLNAPWKQFDAMIEFPRCTCHATDEFKKHNKLMKLMQFLMDLDDSYMQIKFFILFRETFPDVRSAYATISSKESRKVASGSIAALRCLVALLAPRDHGRLTDCLEITRMTSDVGHPNGTEAFISKIGNLRLSNGLVLYDVLVIPEYCVTLMSVHKLAKDNTIFVAFDESIFYFLNQDLNMRNDEQVTTLEDNIFSEGNMDQIPTTSSQAFKYSHWSDARNDEIDSLLRNDTWEIIDSPKDRKIIGSKWNFKIKYKSGGEIDRYKARLVAQGFNQKEGIDYEETFSPVVKWLMLDLPEGYYPTGDNKFDKGVFLALLIYVDDIIITGNGVSEIDKFKVFLKSKFMIKDLGKPKYFHGIEVIDTDKGIFLNQRKYVLDLLSEYGMLACKPVKTLLMTKIAISNEAFDKDPLLDNITDYQKYEYQEKNNNKDKTGQIRARDKKEREKTSPAVPSDFIGPARNPLNGPDQPMFS
ncbi:ribonuclease H-like domain-containing protein [Tanacetum coccineum]